MDDRSDTPPTSKKRSSTQATGLPATSSSLSPGTISSYRRTKQAKRTRTGLPSSAPIQQRMRALRDQQFLLLNQDFQDHLREIQPRIQNATVESLGGDPYHPVLGLVPRAVASYRMTAFEINSRFGGSPAGSVASFGSNETGQLGFVSAMDENGDPETNPDPTMIPSLLSRTYIQVDCGGMHSVALSNTGVPWTWGSNDFGNLGRRTADDHEEMTASQVTGFVTSKPGRRKEQQDLEDGWISQVSAGESHTLFLSLDGNVYSAGMYKEKDKQPFRIVPSQSGDNDPKGKNPSPQHVWQLSRPAIHIYSGGDFAAAILDDYSLVTWGFGTTGELGRSADMATPNNKGEYDVGPQLYSKIVDDKNVFDLPLIREKYMTPLPPRFNWGSARKSVVTVGCGLYHMLVVAREPDVADTHVYSTGSNGYGQLGLGDTQTRHELTLIRGLEGKEIAQVDGGEHFSVALCMHGKRIYTFGRADKGSLGRGPPAKDKDGKDALEAIPKVVPFPSTEPVLIAKISAGDRHVLAVTPENELYTWGYEEACGHGKDMFRPRKLDVSKFLQKRSRVFDIAGGGQHSAMVVVRYDS